MPAFPEAAIGSKVGAMRAISPNRLDVPRCAFTALLVLVTSSCAESERDESAGIAFLSQIAASGSAEPHLARDADGGAVLSWLEPDKDGSALRFSVLDGADWEAPRTVARGQNWFVNWADFPSVVPIDGGLWAAHWLVKKPGGTYAYDVAVSISKDGGNSWSAPMTPHTDDTRTEHGFVSLFPWRDGIGALWLDGRNMAEDGGEHDGASSRRDGMTLRSAVITADGRIEHEQLADDLVCDCCQTDVAIGPLGPIAVYRDRSPEEIRDIYVMRAVDGRWQPGNAVAGDGWEIAGCPVNGPAIAADGNDVAVAWFTAANEQSRVRMARSHDGAQNFDDPIDVDIERPIGRIGVLLLPGGDTLVSWLADSGRGRAELRARRVARSGDRGADHVIATTSAGRISGFPQMLAYRDKVIFAWTDVSDESTRVRSALVDRALFELD